MRTRVGVGAPRKLGLMKLEWENNVFNIVVAVLAGFSLVIVTLLFLVTACSMTETSSWQESTAPQQTAEPANDLTAVTLPLGAPSN